MQLKPNKKSFLIKGLKIKFSLTMILFTFATTPEPQMFDGYLDGLKDELEICYMKLFYKIINLTRRHVNQLKIRVEERIPELEASSYTALVKR